MPSALTRLTTWFVFMQCHSHKAIPKKTSFYPFTISSFVMTPLHPCVIKPSGHESSVSPNLVV